MALQIPIHYEVVLDIGLSHGSRCCHFRSPEALKLSRCSAFEQKSLWHLKCFYSESIPAGCLTLKTKVIPSLSVLHTSSILVILRYPRVPPTLPGPRSTLQTFPPLYFCVYFSSYRVYIISLILGLAIGYFTYFLFFFFFLLFFLSFLIKVFLCSSGWPWIHGNPSPSASQFLTLQTRAIMLDFTFLMDTNIFMLIYDVQSNVLVHVHM